MVPWPTWIFIYDTANVFSTSTRFVKTSQLSPITFLFFAALVDVKRHLFVKAGMIKENWGPKYKVFRTKIA